MHNIVFILSYPILKKLDIIYEDISFMVINKPAGICTQGGYGIKVSLDKIIEQILNSRPFLVHRLDRDTSGLVIVAKNSETAAWFSKSINKIIKRYMAICKGIPARESGVISVGLNIQGSIKKCETKYKLVDIFRSIEEFSMLELELGTGRMHQIRRSLSLIGNPILGDDKYGDFKLNRNLKKTIKLNSLLLFASRLIIPDTCPGRKKFDIKAPMPENFKHFLENYSKLGIIESGERS